jgi:hypothetical protein
VTPELADESIGHLSPELQPADPVLGHSESVSSFWKWAALSPRRAGLRWAGFGHRYGELASDFGKARF